MSSPRASVPVDAMNAHVSFHVRWFGVVRVSGSFGAVGGLIEGLSGNDDEPKITMHVESRSVRTGIGLRDRHLRGPRFLDADRHPRITFVSHHVIRCQAGWDVKGTLTLRGLERALSVSVRERGASSTERRLTVEFSVPRDPHAIGAASGIRRLNPLLWAIGRDVRVHVEIVVPATLLAAEPAPAR